MDWYAPIARHLVIPLLNRRDGLRPGRYVREIAAWERLPAAELAARQWRKVEAIIRHAAATSPYYRRLFAERGLRPDDFDGPDALARLPLLTRELAREHRGEIRSQAFTDSQRLPASTGGTTGMPLSFDRDRDCRDRRVAAHIAFGHWYGFRPGDRVAYAWAAPQDLAGPRRLRARLRWVLENRPRVLGAHAITPDALAEFARGLARAPVRMLRGYPSMLDALARHVAEHGPEVTVPAIVSTADPLDQEVRGRIAAALHGEVFDQYSSRECGLMATECSYHRGLHVNASSIFVEVIVDDRPARPGETGRLVVTDVDNYAFPLLRYEIGDLARWADGPCPCGRALPRLEAIEGRVAEMLHCADGRMVSGHALSRAFAELDLPARLQLVQEHLRAVTVRVVPGSEFGPEHQAAVVATVRRMLGDDVEVTIERVAEIARASSGKYLFATSKVDRRAHAEAKR